MKAHNYTTINDYINGQSKDVQKKLIEINKIIIANAPYAVPSINYGMPAYKLYGKPLVYFAAFDHHIGVYGTPSTHTEFAKALAKYKQGKGSVQFPIDEAIPYDIIGKMVKFKADELEMENSLKKKSTTFSAISESSQKALEAAGIDSIAKLSKCTESFLLSLHGIEKIALKKLKEMLAVKGKTLRS